MILCDLCGARDRCIARRILWPGGICSSAESILTLDNRELIHVSILYYKQIILFHNMQYLRIDSALICSCAVVVFVPFAHPRPRRPCVGLGRHVRLR